MTDYLNIDPDLLRQLAEKHDRIADDTRKWAQPPSEWLNAFPKTYGKIAHPVHQALLRYYTARERAGNALAKEHEATANSLREAARAYERADQDGSRDIKLAGDNVNPQPMPQVTPGGPGTTPPSGPPGGGPA
ncbi:ESX-1 secretion-associated protein, partial [Nocardia wallacei]|uniref:ESX-1 secretion-associated protein n=2 Tax=Nocardia wallacei TaxID=480035 RepID=UPI0024588E78